VRVVVRSEDAMLDQGSNPEFTQCVAERLLIVALVSGQRPQLARVPAGELLTEVGVAPFTSRRAVNVKDRLRRCINAPVIALAPDRPSAQEMERGEHC
jgi:hypothetical protein